MGGDVRSHRGAGYRAFTILIQYLGPEIVNEEGRGSHFAGYPWEAEFMLCKSPPGGSLSGLEEEEGLPVSPGPRILETVYVLRRMRRLAEQAEAAHLLLMHSPWLPSLE